ncbi:hypothetical protein SDC9_164290 [bioreactor metagenome]|uniref:STAS domain-containing protein n=1 Tax=bioreactor metagenome TaxID=1076179 RepID=A0A645FR95_9ZZZZ
MKHYENATKRGQKILFSSVQPKVMEVFGRAGLVKLAGADSFYFSVDKAILEHIVIKDPRKHTAPAH